MRRLILAALALGALAGAARAAGPNTGPWPQYLHDAQHSSSSPFTGPAYPIMANAYTGYMGTGFDGYAPSVSNDGSVYLTVGGTLYGWGPAAGPGGARAFTAAWGLGGLPASITPQPALSDDGQIFISTATSANGIGNSYALSLSTTGGIVTPIYLYTGSKIGGVSTSEGSPILGPGATVYYAYSDIISTTAETGTSFAAIRSTGTEFWHDQETTNVAFSGALSPNGATAYYVIGPTSVVGSGPIKAVNTLTGGAVATSGLSDIQAISVAPNGWVIALRPTGGGFTAYDAALAPQYSAGTPTAISVSGATLLPRPPAISGTTMYLTYQSGSNMWVTGWNYLTGAELWETEVSTYLPNAVQCAGCNPGLGPVTAGNGSLVYVAMRGGVDGGAGSTFFVGLNAANGSVNFITSPNFGAGSLGLGQIVPSSNNELLYFNGSGLWAFVASGVTQFTLTASSPTLIPGHTAQLQAIVKNGSNVGVPNVPVIFQISSGLASPLGSVVTTDAGGIARLTISSSSLDSSVQESTVVYQANCYGFTSTAAIFLRGETVDHFDVNVPTTTPIGVLFTSTITARNRYDDFLPSFPGTSGTVIVNLSPILAGTSVGGSGSLGAASVGIVNGTGTVTNETYNRLESIQIKAVSASSPTLVGISTGIAVTGPDHFNISIPTGSVAGQNFPLTITAMAGGTTVQGYTPTLSITPVTALSTSTTASGHLGATNINMSAIGQVTINNESYSAGGGIQLAVTDSVLGLTSYSSSMTVTQPGLTIDHYHFTAPASVTVGAPFSFQIEAMDASSAPVSYSLNRTLNIQALLANTNFAGSGSLGVTTLPLSAGTTYSFTASQSYNRIETIQFKVTDDDGRVGLSSYTITFTGPTQFVVAVPTAAQAGVPFQFVVQAQDAGNNQVLGYNGTVNVAAVDATTTTLSGGGILGVTSLNLASGTGSSAFQSYTKAQGIRFRVTDSGVGVTSISSSMTVVAGPVASLTLGANPQSTIATVPSVLTALAVDAFNNPILGSTVTFTVQSGSAVVTLGLVNGAVSGAAGVVSTQAPTNVAGSATAFFGSTTTLFSQADVVSASLGGLTTATTIYNAVLITGAGGVVANQGNPQLAVTIPPSAWGFNVRMSVAAKTELSASDLALTTAAFAASANTFVSTTVMHIDVVRDSSPGTLAGAGGRLVTVGLPYTLTTGSVTVGGYHGQSILVPLSVLRVFKLNKQTSIFEMVLDGTNLPQGNGTIAAQVADPEGIFALGVPPFVTLGGASSGTVTTALASGAQAKVSVPFGAFASPTTLTVSPLSAPSIPALPNGLSLTSIGVAISINTNGVQPASPVTVSIGYTAGQVAGLNPNQFKLARYDVGVGWKVLDSQVDTAGNTVTAQTSNFSLFAIVAAAPSNSVSSGFVFPNPFRPSLGHTNIKFMSLPAAAHIRILTVSGRLLKEFDADATGSVLNWTGTDKDGRALPSGVYLAVVSDTTGGSGKATIKFAVQR